MSAFTTFPPESITTEAESSLSTDLNRDESASLADPVCADSPGTAAMDDRWVSYHYPIIYRAAWTMTGNTAEAEDLAQETFVVALDRWDTFAGRSTRSTWLYGILIHLHRRRSRSLSRLKRRLERNANSKNESVHDDPAAEDYYEAWKSSVWSLVAKLPAVQCAAITLRFMQELSYRELAQAMNCSVGTAKSRVHEGIKRLKAKPQCAELLSELNEFD